MIVVQLHVCKTEQNIEVEVEVDCLRLQLRKFLKLFSVKSQNQIIEGHEVYLTEVSGESRAEPKITTSH